MTAVLTRRALLSTAAAGAAVPATSRAVLAGSGGGVPMVLARDVRNGWGVCGRPGIDASVEAYASMMESVGTRSLRLDLVQGGVSAQPRLEQLRAAMMRGGMSSQAPVINALITAYLNDLRTTWAVQQPALLALARTGMLQSIEGPNEINNREVGNGTHGPDDTSDRTGPEAFPANSKAWAEAIARFRRQNAALSGVRLVSPSIASGIQQDYASLPSLAGLADAGNLHFYAGRGRQPGFSIPDNPAVGSFANLYRWLQQAQMPNGPIWMTETGATTSGSYARDGLSQAKYMANQLFDFFALGGRRLFIYQMIDGNGKPGDNEGNFGLFHKDGSPKPAALMLGNLKHLLSLGSYDDKRNLADTGPVRPGVDASSLSLSGERASPPKALMLARSDGSSVVAVWNEPPIDDGNGNELAPEPERVTLDFGAARRFRVRDLLAPASAIGAVPDARAFDSARAATLSLRGYPMLVELDAATR